MLYHMAAQHGPILLQIACARTGTATDTEDDVQGAFLRLLTVCPNFRDSRHENAGLIRVTLQRAGNIRQKAGIRRFRWRKRRGWP